MELSCFNTGSLVLCNSGVIRLANTFPNSTPHWSKEPAYGPSAWEVAPGLLAEFRGHQHLVFSRSSLRLLERIQHLIPPSALSITIPLLVSFLAELEDGEHAGVVGGEVGHTTRGARRHDVFHADDVQVL